MSTKDKDLNSGEGKLPGESGDAGEGDAEGVNPFEAFLKDVDQLKTSDPPEKFASLLVAYQLDERKTVPLSDDAPTGHCVLTVMGDRPLAESDVTGEELILSPNKRVAYSRANTMTADLCQKFFIQGLKNRYLADFFKIHVTFYVR